MESTEEPTSGKPNAMDDDTADTVAENCEAAAKMMDEADVPDPTPMTQQEVENWIMLQTQNDVRWFEMRFVDEAMNNDPTAATLMQSISDVIYAGTVSMVLEERMEQASEDAKGVKLQ